MILLRVIWCVREKQSMNANEHMRADGTNRSSQSSLVAIINMAKVGRAEKKNVTNGNTHTRTHTLYGWLCNSSRVQYISPAVAVCCAAAHCSLSAVLSSNRISIFFFSHLNDRTMWASQFAPFHHCGAYYNKITHFNLTMS